MSKAFNISCIWIVDAESGIFFDDETMIESLTKQYTFLFGYERRPLEREDENSDTEIDIISKKEITTGKCKMPCGHYSGKGNFLLFCLCNSQQTVTQTHCTYPQEMNVIFSYKLYFELR